MHAVIDQLIYLSKTIIQSVWRKKTSNFKKKSKTIKFFVRLMRAQESSN